jgi:hypothetical protein
MATRDDLNTPAIAVVGFVGAVIVFAIIVLLMVVFHHVESRQRYAKDISQPYLEVSQLVADQQGRLTSYGWLDQKQAIVHVPVTRAMDLVVAELSRDPRAPVAGRPK